MDYTLVAIRAAKEAGQILSKAFHAEIKAEAKGAHDVVSHTDYESEQCIINIIKKGFPDHGIVAEESGKDKTRSEFSWYIDPLDGTSNFLLGIPYFSVSIALIYKGRVILGVVYNPILNELYTAEENKGAFLNDQQIYVSSRSDLKNAFIASAYSSDESHIKRGLKTVEQLALNCRKVVINFAPALDLCNIARGKLDALVDNGTTPEDHAAGSHIVTGAGGTVKNYKKNSFNVDETGIISSNGFLQRAIEDLAV